VGGFFILVHFGLIFAYNSCKIAYIGTLGRYEYINFYPNVQKIIYKLLKIKNLVKNIKK
jgi:hypothetical protein